MLQCLSRTSKQNDPRGLLPGYNLENPEDYSASHRQRKRQEADDPDNSRFPTRYDDNALAEDLAGREEIQSDAKQGDFGAE